MVARRNFSRKKMEALNIPAKANRVLNIVLVSMLLIVLRVWHLTVIQHDEKVDESRKPKRRTELESAKRGTIRDRFNIPLALNKLQYNVAVLYSQIRQIPTISWETDETGLRKKHYKRKEYIKSLASLLGSELEMDAGRIEDLIHAKAALYNQIPFVLKENISEKEYYKLKMLEHDWPGISVDKVPRRYYPYGKVASDIIGYMGAINRQEYEAIIHEIKALEEYVLSLDLGEALPLPAEMQTNDDVRKRLKDLQERAYSVNDSIGKGGVEGRYEGILRGYRGKKSYYSDAKGNALLELPGTRRPMPGKRIVLTISSELQEFAEQLLVENEKIRQPIFSPLGLVKKNMPSDKEPWIKGGAIVAMDPNNGDIVAMASVPRFDPNDFIPKGSLEDEKKRKKNLRKWLESDTYLGAIWNGQQNLEREVFDKNSGFTIEERPLTWDYFLEIILKKDSLHYQTKLSSATVHDAVELQRIVKEILQISPIKNLSQVLSFIYKDEGYEGPLKKLPFDDIEDLEEVFSSNFEFVNAIKDEFNRHFYPLNSIYDQVLLVDLYRLAVNEELFSDELLEIIGAQTIASYKQIANSFFKIHDVAKNMASEIFSELIFKSWRMSSEKEFLKGIRAEEKARHKYAKPYTDYLDAKENELFEAFWNQHRLPLISLFILGKSLGPYDASLEAILEPYEKNFSDWRKELGTGAHQHTDWAKSYNELKSVLKSFPSGLDIEYLQTFRSFMELQRPTFGSYPSLRKNPDGQQLEKHLALGFYPKYGYGYGRSQAYRQSATQGSIFKLVTAYEALVKSYKDQSNSGSLLNFLNPLEMHDKVWRKGGDLFLGSFMDGTPIPRHYKGGRMPRSLSANIGHLDVIKAIEMSSNPYFALLAGEYLNSPNDLNEAAKKFSFGAKTGIDLPGEIAGNIPNDLDTNRTGLYSFAIGQHTLVVTPLQTSVMLSALVNGGKVFKPKIVDLFIGKDPKRNKELVSNADSFPFKKELKVLDIDFPLFIGAEDEADSNIVTKVKPIVQRELFYPQLIQTTLLDGMCRVVERTQKEGLNGLKKLYKNYPHVIKDYIDLKKQLLGKTSTAESVENIDLDKHKGTNLYTHVWFGGISYEKDILDENEHRFLFRDSSGVPELVVVVYLRYGGYGKEAAPVAAQIAKKWKEIKAERKEASP